MSPITILQHLGTPGALKGKELRVNGAGQLEVRTSRTLRKFFRNFFSFQATKLKRIVTTAQTLQETITADVSNRYGTINLKDDFNIQLALENVKKVMAELKAEAQALDAKQPSPGGLVFNNAGLLQTHAAGGNVNVATTINEIDSFAGKSIKQIERLKPQLINRRKISFFRSPISFLSVKSGILTRRASNHFGGSPKELQLHALRKDLETIEYELSTLSQGCDFYEEIQREKWGLEYAISQLEMHAPTYQQAMGDLLGDLGYADRDIRVFTSIPDHTPEGRNAPDHTSSKDLYIPYLEQRHQNDPNQLRKVKDLKTIYQASLLVKAPSNSQAEAIVNRRNANNSNLINRGNISHFGYDFNQNCLFSYARKIVRSGVVYTCINGMGWPRAIVESITAATSTYAPGYLGPMAGAAFAVLRIALPIIAFEPKLFSAFVPMAVKGNSICRTFSKWILA